MRDRILDFIDALRRAGLKSSTAESLDAVAAVSVAGLAREHTFEALAATLVKDEADRPLFRATFDQFFRYRPGKRGKTAKPEQAGEGGPGGRGEAEGQGSPVEPRDAQGDRSARDQTEQGKSLRDQSKVGAAWQRKKLQGKALNLREFRQMDAQEQEDCALLAEELAKLLHARQTRRYRRCRRGVVDIRTTIRRSVRHGGVPIQPVFRHRRPGRVQLLVLCDCSYSVATASQFLLALLRPCAGFFQGVHMFGFVDTPVEISFEAGHLVPHQPLDLHARSDFGRALLGLYEGHPTLLTRNTLLLILGDARNNRRPARVDVLARLAPRVKAIVWLNPETPLLWNSGDSVMASYAPHCTFVLAAATPSQLIKSLAKVITL